MRRGHLRQWGYAAGVAAGILALSGCGERAERPREYAGSASCRECHADFYELWSTSHHARALQPWSPELAGYLPPQPEPIEADGMLYQAKITSERGWVVEEGEREYDIAYAIGGKNLYNFLTLLKDGRLQVLPVYYNVQKGAWRNTTRSMAGHFDGGRVDQALHWRDSMLTFNSACFSCHVSQIESNYDPETDTYATVWNEPGISCESCHGPASEHIRVFREAAGGKPPKDMKLIRWNDLSVRQQNDSCSGCHAKAAPITARFETGDRFWDHYDLTTFEHADYYADGRDLGENYTLGSWLLSPCVTKAKLNCTHCHTSSGRYRFTGVKANHACMPCHAQRVQDPADHIHHPSVTQCVSCHMPMNPFGGMNQSEHSMRPPMPHLSMATGSRNACIQCHEDQKHEWALEHIRSWHPDFEQRTAPELHRALLVQNLREGDGRRLSEALVFIADPESDPLFVTSLIRLLPPEGGPQQRAIVRHLATAAEHPLVRSAAVSTLDADHDPASHPALFAALSDDYRLVRIRAAERLAALPENRVPPAHREDYMRAIEEMWDSTELRLDHWTSHYNAANIYMRQERYEEALARYDRAHALRRDIAPPLINASVLLAILNRFAEAEERLVKAANLPEPSAEAHFNLGLLYAEKGRMQEAEKALRKTLELDPDQPAAACNLAILLAARDYPETFRLLQRAIELDPANPRYPQTLAYYYLETDQIDAARAVLETARRRGVRSAQIEAMWNQRFAHPPR